MERDELERLVGGPLRLSFDAILNHPRFPKARHAYLEASSTCTRVILFWFVCCFRRDDFSSFIAWRSSRPRRILQT